VSSLLFLLIGGSLSSAIFGSRSIALLLFVVSICLAVIWFDHHITVSLPLDF